jgi:hypothetical protein
VTRTLLRRIALVYAVKTLFVAGAWLAVPDLPQRALLAARRAWSRVAGEPPAGAREPHPGIPGAALDD